MENQVKGRKRGEFIKTKVWWNVYIIHLDNHGTKTKRTGHTKEYYTGITHRGIHKRLGDYVFGRGMGYVNLHWRGATKKPVYVERLFGTEWEAMQREKQIKHYTVKQKEKLINSDKNIFVAYKPMKAIVLWRNDKREEQICLKIS